MHYLYFLTVGDQFSLFWKAEIFLVKDIKVNVVRADGVRGPGEKGEGIRKYKLVVTG